ncbi:MAG: glycoside hydrolase family 3 N-terminal domain-containing protein [Anaerolineales bacterium]
MASIKQRVKDLVSQMTLDEKLAQLGSYWMYELQSEGEFDLGKVKDMLGFGIGQITRVAGATTWEPVKAAKVGNQIQKFLVENTRLGIPAILHEECCFGAKMLGGSMYPQMIGLASTFEPRLAEEMTLAIRKQLLAVGARQALAPVLDVSRDPRWGRTEETFGEDPTMVSQFGMAYIRGLQGETLKKGVMATGKHFIGHSLSSGGQNCGPVHVGKTELYDIFLAPFQAAIRDVGVASIMNSYPELDGEVVAASRNILTNLLRDKLGFNGLVVSDYEAIIMIHNFHNSAEDKSTAGKRALEAGIDVELPTVACYSDPLKTALESGDVSMEFLDLAVSRHLQKKIELGLLDNPYVEEGDVLKVFETPENRSLAREIASRSLVLLENDGLLPLNKNIKTLAVIGPNADNKRNQLGDYSYAATVELLSFQSPPDSSFVKVDHDHIAKHEVQVISILEGIKKAVSPETKILYARGCDNLDPDNSEIAAAVKAAKGADAVVLVLGDHSGLVPDCTSGEFRDSVDLHLPGVQEELAVAILNTGKPVAAVLVNGRPYAIPWLKESASAILEAWLPGEEGGAAVAEALFGDTNPGGKLPLTFPRHVGQLPIFYNHKPSGMKSHWYNDYVSEKATPLFAFGHGLSYTTFEYSDLVVNQKQAAVGEEVKISLTITNTGKVQGDEVVQLYTRDEIASSPRPMKELKAFIRLGLEPGETKSVTFNLPVNQLAFYDSDLSLVVEPGQIILMVGSSSEDIRQMGRIEIIGDEKTVIKDQVFVCPVEVN